MEGQSHAIAKTAAGQPPRCVMLFSRVDFAWLNPVLMRIMRRRYGTRFVLVIPDQSWRERCVEWCAESDVILDHDAMLREVVAAPFDAEAAFTKARDNERRHGLSYLRDIVQQDRSLSAYYLLYARRSAWAAVQPASWPAKVAEINSLFERYNALFDRYGVDLVLERPGGIASTVCLHAAMTRGIATSFSLPSRHKSFVMWSHGAYLDFDLLMRAYERLLPPPPIPVEALRPPDDSAANIAKSEEWRSLRSLFRKSWATIRDHAIWRAQDFRRGYRGRRLPFGAVMRGHFNLYRSFRDFDQLIERDIDRLCRRRFVLFLLQLEPEFTTISLAREFNDTRAVLQQLALSLPVDCTLVVKEHVTNIGNRDMGFYRDLLRLPNVMLADYRIRGIDLAVRAAAVATISGTVAIEATLLGKPAIIFAPHVEYGFLPSVRLVKSFHDLPAILADATRDRSTAEVDEIRRSGARYRAALESISYDAPGTPVFRGAREDFAEDQAERAVDLLIETYAVQRRGRITSESATSP